ncbi:hypothetical protein AB1N83_013261 [Pleurotus pulmonarius]
MERFSGSQYQDGHYQGDSQDSYRVACPGVFSNSVEDPGLLYAWRQPATPQMRDGYGNNVNHIQEYSPFHHDIPSNQLYNQQVFLAPPDPCPTYTPADNYMSSTHYPTVQPHYNLPDSYADLAPNNVPENTYPAQFDLPGPVNSGTSTVTLTSSRQLATDAVSDAAEKRRVNPHRFFCQYCDRGFTTKHNYHRHLGAHNDERPFSCECGSTFTTKSDLKRHMFKSKKHGNGQLYSAECNGDS